MVAKSAPSKHHKLLNLTTIRLLYGQHQTGSVCYVYAFFFW